MASRDFPRSFPDVFVGWMRHIPSEVTWGKSAREIEEHARSKTPQDHIQRDEIVEKTKVSSLWPAFTSGAGLFSDGYVNASIGTVSTLLSTLYPKEYANSNAISNVASIAFVGIVLGQLSFGYVSDRISRKKGMLFTNACLIFFTLLTCVGTWGAHGSPYGLFAALTTFRFFLGYFIGAEYPTASVLAAEFANKLPAGHRNRYFCWFTNGMIDMGFIIAAFVPLVLLWIFSERHLTAVWRLTLGLGVFPPLILFFLRLKISEGDNFKKLNFNRKGVSVPYKLVFKFYWFRLTIVSLIWFIYDFCTYPFGIYSSQIISAVVPDADIYKTFGWNVVFNVFYIPGAFLGALSADYFGPRLTLATGVGLQGVVGFIMAGCYTQLSKSIAGFTVIYGVFTALGEFGPGDNIGLLASKTAATPVRGQYYGIAAAIGKIGAFIGTYIFPIIIKNAGGSKSLGGKTVPFYVASALCILSAVITLLLCPSLDQDALNKEDEHFLAYLHDNGFDISQLGDAGVVSEEAGFAFDEASLPPKKSEVEVETQSKNSDK